MLNGALLVALALRYDYPLSLETLFEAPVYFVLLTLLWLGWASFFDCYDLPRTADASQSAWATGRPVKRDSPGSPRRMPLTNGRYSTAPPLDSFQPIPSI